MKQIVLFCVVLALFCSCKNSSSLQCTDINSTANEFSDFSSQASSDSKSNNDHLSSYIDPTWKNDFQAGKQVDFPLHYEYNAPGEAFLITLTLSYRKDYTYLQDREEFFPLAIIYFICNQTPLLSLQKSCW